MIFFNRLDCKIIKCIAILAALLVNLQADYHLSENSKENFVKVAERVPLLRLPQLE